MPEQERHYKILHEATETLKIFKKKYGMSRRCSDIDLFRLILKKRYRTPHLSIRYKSNGKWKKTDFKAVYDAIAQSHYSHGFLKALRQVEKEKKGADKQ